MGTLYQRADQYERAAAAYLRSESLAPLDEIAMELRRRSQECLEALGKEGALARDLAERVGEGADDSTVVAEIGQQKITTADLDRMIEEEVNRQLDRASPPLGAEERKKAKEKELERFASPQLRVQFLSSYVNQELLTRYARQTGLANAPETRKLLADVERDILAQRVLEQEFAANIHITEDDVKTFFEANRKKFVRPPHALISIILVKDEKDAKDVLAKLEGGADFAELAKTSSLDVATKSNGGIVPNWIYEGRPMPGVQDSADAYKAIFGTEAGKVVSKPLKSEKGYLVVLVREKEGEEVPTFEKARNLAAQELYNRKRLGVNNDLLRQLYSEYSVVVHQSQFQGTPPDDAKK